MSANFSPASCLQRMLLVPLLLLAASAASAQVTVFINEIHYDNTGGDQGEGVEVAGPAGTDLSDWMLVPYNGNGGTQYNVTDLSGIIVNQQGGLGTLNFPIVGLQNGSPDGIALVNPAGTVVQFLSYEGVVTATDGPAEGMDSVDIGVSEASGSPVGNSLQLIGSGTVAADFTWAESQPNTFGAVNTGQTFGDGTLPPPELVINEIDYDQTGTDTAEFIELRNNGGASVALGAYAVQLVNGSNGADYATFTLPATMLAPGEYFVLCGNAATTPNCDLDVSPNTDLIQNGAPDAVALLLNGVVDDAVSYEGDTAAPFTEGSGTELIDDPAIDFAGISRTPNGADTDQNNVDFSLRCVSPGDDNVAADTNCPNPIPPVVINEIHADPDGSLDGDANNDGVRDSGDDEFLEIVNVSGADLDVSGWTIADGSGDRHMFPAGSVIADQCAVVVFGGGAPFGSFGGALVQTASGGFLSLNNGGDTITLSDSSAAVVATASYGSEGGNNESLTLDPDVTGELPYVQHSDASGASGRLFSPGRRVDASGLDGCVVPVLGPLEIHDIQSSRSASPFVDELVVTKNNVVTALSDDGFFMQTPAARSDANIDTSDGIFVFTGGAPGVQVGDAVDVTGSIVEFFGFTEFTNNPVVTVIGSGASLPAPVVFDATVPSPDPLAPSCAIEFECYEGMLISLPAGTVTGGNQGFGVDPIAEVHITAAGERTFREPGIEFPGLPDLPVWDGNPEVFELDPDRLGLPNRTIAAGASFSAVGVLGFEFGGYELWPSELSVTDVDLPRAVRAAEPREITVGSLNLFRLFDDVDDPPGSTAMGDPTNDAVVSSEEYQRRLAKFANYIVNTMRSPDILAVQEVEKLGVLEDLAAAIAPLDRQAKYEAFLEEGNDIGGIDVGFLVRKQVKVRGVTQLGAADTFIEPDGNVDVIHDRPPLQLEVRVRGRRDFRQLFVIVVHNRSLGGIDGSDGERIRLTRLVQAQSIAAFVQDLQSSEPDAGIVVTGDFNAFEFSDSFVDVIGQIRGDVDPAENLLSGPDLVDPNLLNQVMSLPPAERYSFNFNGNSQVLDHALTNRVLDLRVRGLQFARGNADVAEEFLEDGTTALRSSDHDGLVLYIERSMGRPDRDDDDDEDDDGGKDED